MEAGLEAKGPGRGGGFGLGENKAAWPGCRWHGEELLDWGATGALLPAKGRDGTCPPACLMDVEKAGDLRGELKPEKTRHSF